MAAEATRVGSHRLRRGQEGKGRGNVTPSSLEGQKSPKSTRGRPKKRDKLPLPGKRKIWGTMKQCSAGAVHRAISQITSIASDGIEVRRKYKTDNGKTTRWWHVVSGDEETLKTLESEWEGVQQQLDWKIEPCLAFADTTELIPEVVATSPVTASINVPSTLVPTPEVTTNFPATTSFSTPSSPSPQGNGMPPLEPAGPDSIIVEGEHSC